MFLVNIKLERMSSFFLIEVQTGLAQLSPATDTIISIDAAHANYAEISALCAETPRLTVPGIGGAGQVVGCAAVGLARLAVSTGCHLQRLL